MRRSFFVTLIGSLIIFVPTPAAAGGWWSFIDIGTRYVSEGQRFEIDEDLLFEALGDVEGAQNGSVPYYAYLVADIDEDMLNEAMSKPFDPDWWEPPDDATRVGDITFDRWDSNYAWAHVEIAIPALPGGRYWLMLCNEGCRKPLADVVPSEVFVVEDRLTARFAAKTLANTRLLREKLGPLDRSVELAWDRANAAHRRITELETRLERAEQLLAKERKEGGRLAIAWIPFVGGAGLVALAAWARRFVAARP